MAAYSDSEDENVPPPVQQAAFTACPMAGPLPTPTALALAFSAAPGQLRDNFLLQAQAVALRATPAPAVGSP